MQKDSEKEKAYINTTIHKDLQKSLRILAAHEGVRINTLLEEAIQDLLNKYDMKVPAKGQPQRKREAAPSIVHQDIEKYGKK